MILRIILLILVILALAILIAFSFYIFLPSISKNNSTKNEDPVISFSELNYHFPMNKNITVTDKKAFVMCSCKKSFSLERPLVNENYTCFMEKSLHGSGTDCVFACIGLGDCAKVCFQNAIVLQNRTAVIINELCCGCGKCAEVCPQKIIKMIPKNEKIVQNCASSQENNTSCTKKNLEEKNTDISKKGFKIWAFCYRIIKRINRFLLKLEGN